ncbi:unnamed protein product [Meganyctiphanes norvegica]|uniref:FecR protein domain-containing protein n=1 Tax=Meganyctiphanes norvegica TaxID=48144 RepID=A0AAV2R869_MEGNR
MLPRRREAGEFGSSIVVIFTEATGHLILAILGAVSAGRFGHVHHSIHTQPDQHGSPSETPQPSGPGSPQGGPGFPQGGPGSQQTGQTGSPQITVPTITNTGTGVPIFTLSAINGVMLFDSHACIYRNGKLKLRGNRLGFGESGSFEILSGFATFTIGGRLSINGGLLHAKFLQSTDRQAVSIALTKAGMTFNQFIQQIGNIPPQQGVIDVTAGVISIDGQYRNIAAGILVAKVVDEPTTEAAAVSPQPGFPQGGPGSPQAGSPQTVFVTETAGFETQTVRQPVTLIKTRTLDEYTTVTSPVYNSIDNTITNFDKQTVTAPTEQVSDPISTSRQCGCY